MNIEYFILIAVSVIPIASMFYIPKDKIRLWLLAFLAFQASTWAYTIVLVQKGSLEYPVREFVRSTRINFIPQFLFFPAIFAWFALIYQQRKGFLKKVIHFLFFVSIPIWFSYFASKYTNLENFGRGTPHTQLIQMYISFPVQFIIGHLYITWFQKKVNI